MDFDITSEQGFEAMYREYFPKIYNYIFYRVLSREAAEDIVSDIFMKAARSRHSFDAGKAAFSTWIFRIARNALIDYFRRRKVHADLDDVAAHPALQVDFEDQLNRISDPQRKALYQALAELKERERLILYYKFFEEKNNRQIAMLLDMNESTVGTVLSRTLKKLRLPQLELD